MRQTRFRASIYLDIYINEEEVTHVNEVGEPDETRVKDIEEMRDEARKQVQSVVDSISKYEPIDFDSTEDICNPYVGDVAKYTPKNLLKPFDRDI